MSANPKKSRFPYPLQLGVLEEFCHPAAGHALALPMWHEDAARAGNGWLALAATRGLWVPGDFPPASEAFAARVGALPWHQLDYHGPSKEWREINEVRLFAGGPLPLWRGRRPAPSPVWRVAEVHLVRLSHLQLISRLPRCEVFCGPCDFSEPLFFRFSGGRGMIARDAALTIPSRVILSPRRDPYTGDRLARQTTPAPNFGPMPLPEPALPDWPPAEAAD